MFDNVVEGGLIMFDNVVEGGCQFRLVDGSA